MSLKRFTTESIVAGIICISVGLFCGARYMGWLEQDSSPLGNLARFVYGPDVRREMNRLKIVKETTPEIPRITAICYHEVRPDRREDSLNVDPETFRRHIREFKEAGYSFIGVNDLRQYKTGLKNLPEKAAFITFDDGYADNYNYAYPILREEHVPGIFFVVSSTVGGKNRMTASCVRCRQTEWKLSLIQ